MQIEILEDAHHRLSSAISQAFAAKSVVNVPRATAEALIARGKARPVPPRRRVSKPESNGD